MMQGTMTLGTVRVSSADWYKWFHYTSLF